MNDSGVKYSILFLILLAVLLAAISIYPPIWPAGILFVMGVLVFISGFKEFMKKRMIENIPTSKVRSIAMGLTEIYGNVLKHKNKLITSFMQHTKCVYYRYLHEEYVEGGKNQSGHWRTVRDIKESIPFYIKDETGKVLVDVTGAEVSIKIDTTRRSFDDRYTEYAIVPGDKLYVLGTAGNNPHMKSSDKNEETIMIQKDHNIYFISDRSEKDIIKRLKIKAIAGIVIGSILLIGSIPIFFMLTF